MVINIAIIITNCLCVAFFLKYPLDHYGKTIFFMLRLCVLIIVYFFIILLTFFQYISLIICTAFRTDKYGTRGKNDSRKS